MRTDLNISTTNTDGTKKTSKLSYVNPEANDGALATLVNKITDLSNDTLTAATRSDITDLSTNFTPVRVDFYGVETEEPYIMPVNVENIDNQYSVITIGSFNEDKSQELPIMVPNLQPYIKENNTRVQVTIYKDTNEEQLMVAQVGLAITTTSGSNNKEEPDYIIPKYTGDIIIGTKTISGNYQNVAPDLIIRIIHE